MPAEPISIAHGLENALSQPNPLLFVGAGVGRRVGLPDWYEYLEHLAGVCDRYGDPLSAQLIRHRVSRGYLLEAAAVYKTCDAIPSGELLKELASPFNVRFEDDAIDRITPLVGLGFTAIATTNYDRSLHEACSRAGLGWVTPVERGDGSLSGASLKQDFFIARIHGRAEQPSRMVIDTQDYRDLAGDQAYTDFLLHLMKSRSCLFVGFSFVDPAINHLLATYKERFGPEYQALHTALIPSDARGLAARLREVNIRTGVYSPDEGHVELWRGIRDVFDVRHAAHHPASADTEPVAFGFSSTHRYLAFALAQIRSNNVRKPLAEVVQDGVVLSLLSEAEGNVLSESDVVTAVRGSLGLTEDEAKQIVAESVARLESRNQAVITEGQVGLGDELPNELADHLNELATNVLDRMRVREQVKGSQRDHAAAASILEAVFMSRAWDVAAHFAGSAAGWGSDLPLVVKREVEAELRRRMISAPGAMERAINNLLISPEDRESEILSAVGRAAFGVQLIISTPRQLLFRKYSLPERVYLDANVLMPALVEGHPLRPVYVDSLRSLSEACDHAGIPLKVMVGMQFLNEVISHREIARNLVTELDLEDPEKLYQHIRFFGATNTNVFVAAYASFVRSAKKRSPFNSFLEKVAPYKTEEALAGYLNELRIYAEVMDFERDRNQYLVDAYNPLLESYEHVSEAKARKRKLLIRHEAEQLVQLRVDTENGLRPIFVTADQGLRRALHRDTRLHRYASLTLSHIGLAALVDVLVGLETDSRSLARLIWATQRSEKEQAIFEYLVRVGIEHYQEGMAMEMQQAAQEVASQAAQRAERDRIPLFGKDPKDIAQTTEFLDRFQDMFFRYWREAIDRRENTAE